MTAKILEGYVDTSGKDTNPADKLLIVCGCLSTPLKWQEFDNEWQAYLKNEGFPPDAETGRYVFHTSEFWVKDIRPKPEKTRIYRNLIAIIAKHTLYQFGYGVLLNDFRQLEAEIPHLRQFSGKPGTMICQSCFKQNSEWAKQKGYNPSIAYVSDKGDEYWEELFESYSRGSKLLDKGEITLPEGGHRTVSSLTCANKAMFSGIQAADIMAWECRQFVLTRPPSLFASAVRPRPEMIPLSKPGKSDYLVYGRRKLKYEILEKFESLLDEMGMTEEQVSILVGEDKVFKNGVEMLKVALKIRKQEELKKQLEAREKREKKS